VKKPKIQSTKIYLFLKICSIAEISKKNIYFILKSSCSLIIMDKKNTITLYLNNISKTLSFIKIIN